MDNELSYIEDFDSEMPVIPVWYRWEIVSSAQTLLDKVMTAKNLVFGQEGFTINFILYNG